MASEALGLLETRGLVALIEAVDAMLKTSPVRFAGWDRAGSGLVSAFVNGDVAAVRAAIDAGAEMAGKVGEVTGLHVIARPHDGLRGMMPASAKPASTEARPGALGLLETKGWASLVEATDAMCKAAEVQVLRTVAIGSSYVTTAVHGDVGSVKAAIEAGSAAAARIGQVVAAHVIAKPHQDLLASFGI